VTGKVADFSKLAGWKLQGNPPDQAPIWTVFKIGFVGRCPHFIALKRP